MSLTREIAHNTFYQVAGKVLATFLGLLVIGLMTRHLGQDGFGQLATITAFLQFFGIIVDFGLTLITLQMISVPGADENKIINNIFTIRFFSALIFLGLAPLVVLFFPYSTVVKVGVVITTFSFFCITLNSVLFGVFQKHLRTDKVAIAEIFGRIALLVGVLLAIFFNQGLLAVLAAIVLGSFVNFFLSFIFARRFVRIRFAFDFKFWREIIRRSWPIGLSIIFNLAYLKTDTIILSLYHPQQAVGIYSASYRVLEVLIQFPILFMGLILPLLTTVWINHDSQRFKNIMQKAFDVLVIVTLPLVVGILFIAEPLMALIAGQDFVLSAAPLQILIIAVGLIFLANLFTYTIVAIGKQRLMIWGYFSVAVLGLIWYFIFIPRYSYFGAAWGTVFTEGLILIIATIFIGRVAGFWPRINVLIKSAAACTIMAYLLYFAAQWNLILLILAAAAIYFVVLYLLGGFSRQTIQEVIRLK